MVLKEFQAYICFIGPFTIQGHGLLAEHYDVYV